MGIKDDPLYKKYVEAGKAYTYKEIREIIDSGKKPMLFYHIPRHEVENKDFSGIDKLMNTIQNVGKECCQSLILTVNGYDDTAEELFEIEEVVQFVNILFAKYPNLLYYVSTFAEADGWLINCYADSLTAIRSVESRMTAEEVYEKYGFSLSNVPRIKVTLDISEEKQVNVLKGIVKHSKLKKDAMRGKRIALYYIWKYFRMTKRTNIDDLLKVIKVTPNELPDLMGQVFDLD